MARLTSIGILAIGQMVCQTSIPDVSIVGAETAASQALAPYSVYRHFLIWVNQLDKASTASGTGDPYRFAEALSRANFQHQHLDILRNAARHLDAELQQHQLRAQLVITRYRQIATDALAQGRPLPPPPPEIRDLEREHTAILIDHYVALRAALGSDVTAQLDAYLRHEFTPHIKLRHVTTPGVPVQVTPGN